MIMQSSGVGDPCAFWGSIAHGMSINQRVRQKPSPLSKDDQYLEMQAPLTHPADRLSVEVGGQHSVPSAYGSPPPSFPMELEAVFVSILRAALPEHRERAGDRTQHFISQCQE